MLPSGVIKHGWLENGPSISDFPCERNLHSEIGNFPARHVWWNRRVYVDAISSSLGMISGVCWCLLCIKFISDLGLEVPYIYIHHLQQFHWGIWTVAFCFLGSHFPTNRCVCVYVYCTPARAPVLRLFETLQNFLVLSTICRYIGIYDTHTYILYIYTFLYFYTH